MVTRTTDLAVELCGIALHTPLLPAAGTASAGVMSANADIFGAVVSKTVTLKARPGNPPPRVAETPSGMVNFIGLQNPGLEAFVQNLGNFDSGVPLIMSVAGDTVGEFVGLCRRMAVEGRVSAVEINLSCPNVEHGGLLFCAGPESVAEVVAACRDALPGKPLFVKLTNEGVLRNSLAAEEAGADALTLINTVPALTVDARERRVLVKGGLSGPAIKPVALRAVYEVSRAVEVPVIGCGGVARGTDVAEFMLAGAAAVQVGSGSFAREPREILGEFAVYLGEMGLTARDLAGALGEAKPLSGW